MMPFNASRLLNLSVVYWAAAFFALAVMLLVVTAPHWMLEAADLNLGLETLTPLAAPPIGHKARILMSLLAGGVTMLSIALPYKLFRFIKPRRAVQGFAEQMQAAHSAPADVSVAKYDELGSSSRRPIFADQELGAPLMSDAALEKSWDYAPINRDEESHTMEYSKIKVPVEPVHIEPVQNEKDAASYTSDAFAHLEETFVTQPQTAENAAAPTTLHGMSLQEMIARLEAGLAKRNAPQPEPPHAGAAQPSGGRESIWDAPATPPLTVVPAMSAPQGENEQTLRNAMETLSNLVSRAS